MSAIKKEDSYLDNLYKIRADTLQQYATGIGNDRRLADLLEVSPTQVHRLIRKRDVPFTEKMARFIEAKLDKPLGWLDGDAGQHSAGIPVYFLEDIQDMQNIKPASSFRYFSEIEGAFFIQITHASYEPIIKKNSKILINPNETIPKNGKIYLVSFLIDKHPSRPVLRKYDRSKYFDLVERPEFLNFDDPNIIYGECDTIIQPA